MRRLMVFGMVGTVNTVVCYALFAALVHVFEWDYNLALVADYAFGAGLGYGLHRVATFADRKHVKQAFGKYALTLVITFLANLLLLDVMVRRRWFDPLVAQALAMGMVTLLSYALQKHWVFRSHAPKWIAEGDEAAIIPFPRAGEDDDEVERRAA